MGHPAIKALYGDRECDKQEVRDELHIDLKKWEAKDSKTARRIAIIKCQTIMEQFNISPDELK